MHLSEERAIHIAHRIVEALLKHPEAARVPDPVQARKAAKEAMLDFLRVEEEIEGAVRGKIGRMPKGPPEGSSRWKVLYDQFLAEERVRRGLPR